MTTMTLQLPESLGRRAKRLAKREGISVDQLVASALAEKLAALVQPDYLEQRASRSSRAKYLAALAWVPDRPPAAGDEIPPAPQRRAQAASPRAGRVGQ